MFRLAVSSSPDRLAATIRTLRKHTDLSVAEIRARVADGGAVVEFHFHKGMEEIRRCRSFLREVEVAGGSVRVFEHVDGFGEHEESLAYLRNVMRRNIQIRRQVLDDIEREVAADGDEG
jgi:hypothetical protein